MKPAREPASSHPKRCVSLKTRPRNISVRRSSLALVGRNRPWSGISFASEISRFAPLNLSPNRVRQSPGSSTIELLSTLAEFSAYPPDRACHSTLARSAATFQDFRDSAPYLSRANISRRAPNWSSEEARLVSTILDQPNRRRISIQSAKSRRQPVGCISWSIVPAKAALVRNYFEVYWPCARGLSAVNAIGTQLPDRINSGLIRWRMAV